MGLHYNLMKHMGCEDSRASKAIGHGVIQAPCSTDVEIASGHIISIKE